MNWLWSGLWVTLACTALSLAAEPPLTTDRPDQADSPLLVPRGLVQLEAGLSHGRRDLPGEELALWVLPGALLRYGVTESLELRLGVPGYVAESLETGSGRMRRDGLLDVSLGLKFRLLEAAGRAPAVALVGSLLLPTGHQGFSTGQVDPGFRLAFSNALTRRVSLTYNAGMFWLSRSGGDAEEETRSYYDWAVTCGTAATPRLGVFAEIHGVAAASAGGRPVNSLGAGITYLVRPRIQLDARITAGVSSQALDWTAAAGVSYRFPRSRE